MIGSITNMIKSLYRLWPSTPSESEILEGYYKKSRKAASDFAKENYHEEDLFYKPLAKAQKIEYLFLRLQEERSIQEKHTAVDNFLANIGSFFIEQKLPEEQGLQYRLDRLWMILNNSSDDTTIKNYLTNNPIDSTIMIANRNILNNETARLYKSFKEKFPELKDDPNCSFKYNEFPLLACPVADEAKKQAKHQLQTDKDAGFIAISLTLATTALVTHYAIKHFYRNT